MVHIAMLLICFSPIVVMFLYGRDKRKTLAHGLCFISLLWTHI